MSEFRPSRRRLLRGAMAGAGAGLLAGCDALSKSERFVDVLGLAEPLSQRLQRALTGNRLAAEFPSSMISPLFRPNGSIDPRTPEYLALKADAFRGYRLQLRGLVERPLEFSLDALRTLPARTQITRHDCVEGWSVIGQWSGVPLAHLLALARPRPGAAVQHDIFVFALDHVIVESIAVKRCVQVDRQVLGSGVFESALEAFVGHRSGVERNEERALTLVDHDAVFEHAKVRRLEQRPPTGRARLETDFVVVEGLGPRRAAVVGHVHQQDPVVAAEVLGDLRPVLALPEEAVAEGDDRPLVAESGHVQLRGAHAGQSVSIGR